jgi:hypothetical protein
MLSINSLCACVSKPRLHLFHFGGLRRGCGDGSIRRRRLCREFGLEPLGTCAQRRWSAKPGPSCHKTQSFLGSQFLRPPYGMKHEQVLLRSRFIFSVLLSLYVRPPILPPIGGSHLSYRHLSSHAAADRGAIAESKAIASSLRAANLLATAHGSAVEHNFPNISTDVGSNHREHGVSICRTDSRGCKLGTHSRRQVQASRFDRKCNWNRFRICTESRSSGHKRFVSILCKASLERLLVCQMFSSYRLG